MSGTNNPLLVASPSLQTSQITDTYTKKNFENLVTYFSQNNQLLNFKFFEVSVTKATPNLLVAHGLSSIPKDIIVTQVTGKGQATFNYGLFDGSNVNITTTDACRVRFFVGTYYNQPSALQANKTDLWLVNPASGGTSGSTSGTIPWKNQTGNYQLLITDQGVGFTCGNGAVSAALPDATKCSGQFFTIAKMDGGSGYVTLNANGQTIGGFSGPINLYLKGDVMVVQSDGINFQITSPLAKNRIQFSGTFSVNGTGYGVGTNVYFDTILFDTSPSLRAGYGLIGGGQTGYKVAAKGYFVVGFKGQQTSGNQLVQILVNGAIPNSSPLNLYLNDMNAQNGFIFPGSIPIFCNADDLITWEAGATFTNNFVQGWVNQVG